RISLPAIAPTCSRQPHRLCAGNIAKRPKRTEPLSDGAPREIGGANAPLSAAGSAAQRARIDEDHSDAFIGSAEEDRVGPRFRVVAGAQSVIGPVVEDDEYKLAVRASDPGDEDEDEDWPEDLPEDLTEDLSENLPEDLPEDLPRDLLDSASEI